MKFYKVIIAYIKSIKFRRQIVRKVLFSTTSADEVRDILDSLNARDRQWVQIRIKALLIDKEKNEMKKEFKEYNRKTPRWKRKFELKELEKRLYG